MSYNSILTLLTFIVNGIFLRVVSKSLFYFQFLWVFFFCLCLMGKQSHGVYMHHKVYTVGKKKIFFLHLCLRRERAITLSRLIGMIDIWVCSSEMGRERQKAVSAEHYCCSGRFQRKTTTI